jgi:antitoxin ParD1/3/4
MATIEREPTVPTRNISLTPEQDAFVEEAVKSGEYQNASEMVRDALRALQQRRREDALKLEALRRQIDAGIDALERGKFTEIADAELDAYLDRLAARPGKEVR